MPNVEFYQGASGNLNSASKVDGAFYCTTDTHQLYISDGTKLYSFDDLPVVSATSTDGVAYTATITGINELSTGLTIVIVPATVSTSTTPTLNLNSLGAKGIRRVLSNLSTSAQSGSAVSWIAKDKAYILTYDGSYWIVNGMTKPAASDLDGQVAIEHGGTGASTAEAARGNLGAAPAYTYGTTDLTAGSSTLATGTLYFVYE